MKGQPQFGDTDGDILVYHYYDGNNNGYPAPGINVLGWTSDGWPHVQQRFHRIARTRCSPRKQRQWHRRPCTMHLKNMRLKE